MLKENFLVLKYGKVKNLREKKTKYNRYEQNN